MKALLIGVVRRLGVAPSKDAFTELPVPGTLRSRCHLFTESVNKPLLVNKAPANSLAGVEFFTSARLDRERRYFRTKTLES